MKRRHFLKNSAWVVPSAAALGSSSWLKGSQQKNVPVVIDGMGEIRIDYPMDLLSEVISSGTTAVQVTVGNPNLHGPEAATDALNELAAYEHYIDSNRDYLLKATRVADIDRARREKKLALMFLFQNTSPLADDLGKLTFFYALGVRCIQLTYNSRNLVGDGCTERTDCGISDFGLRVISRMNEMGILIDLSHAGNRTMNEAIAFSRQPVIMSHGGCKAVYENPRTSTDKNIRALAEKGGVIGIFQINPNLGPKERNTLDDYLNHIDHVANIAGVEHVGIGSDREHKIIPDTEGERRRLEAEMARVSDKKILWPFFLSELNHPRRMETIRDGLKKRGHTQHDIDKIMGSNFYRVFKDIIG